MKKPRGIPKSIIVKARCPCGNGIQVKIFDKGEALDQWVVACQNHRKMHLKLVLGIIRVTGKPPSPDAAAMIVQRAVRDRVPVIRTTPNYEPFTHKVRF